MQAIKKFLVVSAIAVIAASPDLRADDAQLREALRKADGQTSVPPPAKPIPPVAPAPAAKPAPPVTKAVPPADQASKPLSANEAAALKSALRQQSGQPTPAVVPKPAPAPAPLTQPTPAPVAAPIAQPAATSAPAVQWGPTPAASEDAAALKAALRQKMAEPLPEPSAVARPGSPAPVVASAPSAFAPIESPPSSIPAGKEQRLADLLRLYKADVITPADYHKQRAAILAE